MSDFKSKASSQKTRFLSVWPRIKSELVAYMESNGMPQDACQWFEKVRTPPYSIHPCSPALQKQSLEYNTPGGKLNRGISVIDTAEILLGRPLSDQVDAKGTSEFYRAVILGWGIELLQAYFLVSDDMMDGSITRRGQPCW
jgi:farnesyl diphosphate synthase